MRIIVQHDFTFVIATRVILIEFLALNTNPKTKLFHPQLSGNMSFCINSRFSGGIKEGTV